MTTETCNCVSYKSNPEVGDCPSPGCTEFLVFMNHFHKVNWESVKWGFLDKDDFIIGPNSSGVYQNEIDWKIILGQETIDECSIPVTLIEKW